jgi:pimeloyl-ACP methyl ester carboxylesterase
MSDGWSRVEIAGKPADVFEPLAARFALLWLHEREADPCLPVGLPLFTSLLHQHHLRCLAPYGDSSWWVDRICPSFDPEITAEKHLLHNVLPWMEERFQTSPRSIAVAGVEMGGQGAVRLALTHPKVFRAAASLGGAFDFHELHGRGTPLDDMYESRERCRLDTAILQMHPVDWPPHLWFACDPSSPWFRGNDRLHEKLRAYGVPHTADLETTGADSFERMLEPMLQFLINGLEKESRRLM